MSDHFLAFPGISILVIATPGPDTALTIRNTLLGGRRGGVFTALGVASDGDLGARHQCRHRRAPRRLGAGLRRRQARRGGLSRHPRRPGALAGAALRLGNPKVAVFFTSLLPQFAPEGGATFAALFGLGLVFSLLTFTWLALYAGVVARAGDVLRRTRIRRAVEGVTGAVLVALGLRIAAEHH
jgi:threonine/homoserine/homoserine lactone efflux protein